MQANKSFNYFLTILINASWMHYLKKAAKKQSGLWFLFLTVIEEECAIVQFNFIFSFLILIYIENT